MTATVRALLALADGLVACAKNEAVAVDRVEVDVVGGESHITLRAAEPELTPALALALGLTRRTVLPCRDSWVLEVFSCRGAGLTTWCQHTIPTDEAAWRSATRRRGFFQGAERGRVAVAEGCLVLSGVS